jgi:ABC-type antimicrobial peptide transport system permease subunit
MVFSSGMNQAIVGLAIGLAASALLSRGLSSLLTGVTPLDPATAAVVSAGFVVTACVANAAPAWRAARLNPVDALAGR